MDWKRTASTDPDGLTGLLLHAHQEIGDPPLSGTRFLCSDRDMLAQMRKVEAAVLGTPTTVYAGCQSAERFEREAETFRDLVDAGTDVIAFGTGRPDTDVPLRWVDLPADPDRLENQWYLVARGPTPTALVGFETNLNASSTARMWDGFISHDGRLVEAMIDHLDAVARSRGPSGRPRQARDVRPPPHGAGPRRRS